MVEHRWGIRRAVFYAVFWVFIKQTLAFMVEHSWGDSSISVPCSIFCLPKTNNSHRTQLGGPHDVILFEFLRQKSYIAPGSGSHVTFFIFLRQTMLHRTRLGGPHGGALMGGFAEPDSRVGGPSCWSTHGGIRRAGSFLGGTWGIRLGM